MAKKGAAKHVEPEDISQDVPDEEPAVILESGGPVNQADLVRKAVSAGHEKPATGVPYIKAQFGVDVDPKYYSVAKSNLKKREAKASFSAEPARRGRKPTGDAAPDRPRGDGYVAPPEEPKAAGEPDVLLALEGIKELVSQFGADKVRRMVDIIG